MFNIIYLLYVVKLELLLASPVPMELLALTQTVYVVKARRPLSCVENNLFEFSFTSISAIFCCDALNIRAIACESNFPSPSSGVIH